MISVFLSPLLATAAVVEDAIEVPQVAGAAAGAVGQQHSILDLLLGSGLVVQGVLLLLVGMSVVTWGIVFKKWSQIRRAKAQSDKFIAVFWEKQNLEQINDSVRNLGLTDSPVANVYRAGHRELKKLVEQLAKQKSGDLGGGIENIERALKRAKTEEVTLLEGGTTFLATTASAAPFIGLFGTVWGIMNAFIGLSKVQSSSIQAVAPGISEALIATAIGLAAAIPAAMAYNFFMQKIRVLGRDMDMFAAEFLNIARRHFLR